MLPSSRETLWAPPSSQTSEQSQLAETRPAPTPDSHHREDEILVAAPHLFSQPKFGSGCQVPGEGGAGMARPEGHGDTGQSDWPHTRTGAPSREWSGGQHRAPPSGSEAETRAGGEGGAGSLAVRAVRLAPDQLRFPRRVSPHPEAALHCPPGSRRFPGSTPFPTAAPLWRSPPATRAREFGGRWSGCWAGPEAGGGPGAAASAARVQAGARPGRGAGASALRAAGDGASLSPPAHPPAPSQVTANLQDGGSAPGRGLPVHGDPRWRRLPAQSGGPETHLPVRDQLLEETPDSHQGGRRWFWLPPPSRCRIESARGRGQVSAAAPWSRPPNPTLAGSSAG